jgi:hypothetical protein
MRAHAGLFDLISRYKAAMASSLPAAPQDQDFRKLEELFIAPVYLNLPSGGKLDLMPAGRRGSDEQLSEYALGLRQFDWQDFYFNFGGEVFFEWLRRSLDSKLYDVVLVDSRTGVTEMGGICAYQLADLIVVMCAPNQQNLDGTHDVVRNFFSPRVTMLRSGRPLQLLVVPSRVETRDESLLRDFRGRFEKLFAGFTPKELARHGVAYWDLMIPYDLRSAFQEGVVAQDSRAGARSTINPAIQNLVRAIGLLAEPGQPIHKFGAAASAGTERAEPQYDVTSRAAGYDLFLAYLDEDADAVGRVARSLGHMGCGCILTARNFLLPRTFKKLSARCCSRAVRVPSSSVHLETIRGAVSFFAGCWWTEIARQGCASCQSCCRAPNFPRAMRCRLSSRVCIGCGSTSSMPRGCSN